MAICNFLITTKCDFPGIPNSVPTWSNVDTGASVPIRHQRPLSVRPINI